MGSPRRSKIDWYSVFRDVFSHDGAVRTQVDDGEHYFRLTRRRPAAEDAGPDVDVPSASEGLGPDVDAPSASEGLGPDVPSASKGVPDFSPMDEDEQGEHVSSKDCSKLSPDLSGEKKNNGKLPLNKKKSQGHGGKKKPSVRAHAIDPEEFDYESSLPSRPSKRTKKQLQNSSSAFSGKVQDVVLLDDEDMEPKEEVNREMSDRLNEQKIYYPSRDDQEAVELTRSDMKCLDPEVFLSSPVINFYIQYIKRTRLCNENFRDKFYIFNTYFFGKLEEALHQRGDFPKLRRWWKGVNIFNNAYIILPIHGREHWSLVIICLPPKERVSEPIILHLDSLGMHRSAKILKTVGRFLEKEWCFLSDAEAAWPRLLTDIRKETVQVPQQNNAYDCGIFMLYYIKKLIKEAPARFTPNKLGMFNRSWFKPEEAFGLRQRIRELLLHEFESAKLLDDAIPEADGGSEMAVEVGVGLGNTVESNGGMKVAASEEAGGELGDAVKSTAGGIIVAASEEASGESGDAVKSTAGGINIAESQGASGDSGDAVNSTGGIKVATSQEASEEFLGAGVDIVGIKVAQPEKASEESGDSVKSIGGSKVQDVVLLNNEDMEPKEKVNREMSDKLNEQKIYYPSRDDQEAVELTRSDMKCLDPEVFLSSPVINFYIQYIKRTILSNEKFRDKFYIFNTYFYGKLEEALHEPGDFPKLRRWWKGVNIFNNAYIILPIHGREHWSLVIICLPPKERVTEPIILHLDSLRMHRSAKILKTVGRYLEKEWCFLSDAEAAWPCLLTHIRKGTVQVPQQNNVYDCGIFMLYYIEQFIKDAPARFTTDKLGMFNRCWFKPEEASGLRQRIRELLLQEFESARLLDDAIPEADASKGYDRIKDGGLEADDSSIMVVEAAVGLGNIVKSNAGMNVAASEDASGESGDAVKSTAGGINAAASEEASEESRDAVKSTAGGMNVAESEEASGESRDAVNNTGSMKVGTLQEASEEFLGAGMDIVGMKVAEPEKASEESGDSVKSTGGTKVQNVLLLNNEDMEPKEKVNREMSDRLNEQKIYYPSRDDQEAVELTRSDMKYLYPEVFLSSPVINFYIQYIKRTRLCNEKFRDKFYIFNTYFYGKLEEALHEPGDFQKLRRWWKGVNIFNNAYIILPIHGREHWSLVIICLPPKERVTEPIILHLDSLRMHRSAKILKTVGRYLEKEWCYLSDAEAAWPCLLTDIRKGTVQVPQQNNAYDCGIFMLYYIEQFIKDAPARFTTDKLGMFNRSWFKPEEASSLRQRIRELVLQEFESARLLDDAIPEADTSKGYDGIMDGELEAHDSSKMVVEVGVVGLGNTVESNGGMKVAASEEASKESGDAVKSTGGIKAAASQEASEESQNAGKSTEGIDVTESEEASEVSSDAAMSVEGNISVVESDNEASEQSGDTGKTDKGIKVLASEEATVEYYGHPASKSTEDISDAPVLNKGPTSSSNSKCNDPLRVLAEAAAWSESVNDRKGTAKKADPGSSSRAAKEGEPAERLKGTSTPAVPDVASDNGGGKRSEGNNEEAIGSNCSTPVAPPDAAVCEESGTKVWITRVYKPTIAWPPGNWSRSSGGSSRDARRQFIEHFCGKK